MAHPTRHDRGKYEVTPLSRPYADEADYARMRALVTEIVALGGDAHQLTLGDLDWWRAGKEDPTLFDTVHLWFGPGDELRGFAWRNADNVDLAVHPHHESLFETMLAWSEEMRRSEVGTDDASPSLAAWAFDGDAVRVETLRRRGYARQDRCLRYRRHALADPLPVPPLPPGYAVRQLAGAGEVDARVAVHRAAFAPSRMTVAKHEMAMRGPTYRWDLDLVVVAPNGAFAAFCLVWFDAANRMGLFEPVGTAPAYQRRGLGKAVLAEGLRRLRALGARAAFVNADGDAPASNALYELVGFRIVGENHAWTRAL